MPTMNTTLHIEIPDDVLLGMQKNKKDFSKEMRLAAAVKWYELGMISQDKAAQIAGLSRSEFIVQLTRFKVSPFQETSKDVLESIQKLA